jgi:hypothetical protein
MPRDSRRLKNREVFRSVNDRIAEVAAHLWGAAELQTFICECDRMDCTEEIQAPIEVYDRIRETAGAYLVRAGHEDPSETVVFEHGGYLMVIAPSDP